MGMPGHTGHSGESDEEGAASQSCTVVRQQPDTSCRHIRPRASECQVRLNVAGVQTCRMNRQVQIQWPLCTSSFKRSTQRAGVWTRQCRDQRHGCASPGTQAHTATSSAAPWPCCPMSPHTTCVRYTACHGLRADGTSSYSSRRAAHAEAGPRGVAAAPSSPWTSGPDPLPRFQQIDSFYHQREPCSDREQAGGSPRESSP